MTEAELTELRRAAYEAACLADNAWADELARTYPNDNNHGRYERHKNRATPLLKALDDVRAATTEAWLKLGKIARNEI
jgi:hypothetical protein